MMKSEIGRMKEKVRFGRMIFCKVFFIVVLWALLCCFPLSKGVLQGHFVLCCWVIENSNNDLFSSELLTISSFSLFCHVALPFLVIAF
jgi:hypothetical protein